MRIVSFFFSLAFLVFFGIGYWSGSQRPAPTVEQQIMRRLVPTPPEKPQMLVYHVDKTKFAAYSPTTDKLTTNIVSEGHIAVSPNLLNPQLLTLIGGAGAGLNIDAIAKNKSLVRLLNRATGKSKTKRVLGTIAGAISGYSMGEYFGSQSTIEVASKEIQALLTTDSTWKSIKSKYSLYRLSILGEALEDLPDSLSERYTGKIQEAEAKILSIRSSKNEDTFLDEMAIVSSIEAEVEPHFHLIRGTWDKWESDVLEYLRWAMYLVLAFFGWIVICLGYGAIRSEKTAKRKNT